MPATQLALFERPGTVPGERMAGYETDVGGNGINVHALHQERSREERGAVFTRPEVVSFMLDLAEYRTESDLSRRRVLEPAAGDGAFAVQVVDRMVRSFLGRGGQPAEAQAQLQDCLVAVEVFAESAAELRVRLATAAKDAGLTAATGASLARTWVRVGDFLLTDFTGNFDLVVGNPPYLRQESIPAALLTLYRQRFSTLFNRADLYVLFFERGLSLLKVGGKLAFICSDRWMKCAYGKPLRALIAREFNLDAFVDMVDTPAFTSEVIAYPAITVISRSPASPRKTLAAFRPALSPNNLQVLAAGFAVGKPDAILGLYQSDAAAVSSAPWLFDADDTLPLLRDLERRFPVLEAAGCRVGIGVATGCDRVFIGDYEYLDVEPRRKLRLVMADCIRSGRLQWGGQGLVNPFEPDGTLADPQRYPRFAAFLERHAVALKQRNIAKRAGAGWYRTIDRVWHHLTATPKLLIPDIKGEPNVVIDAGEFYPHHNLYWVTSEEWGLPELQAMLRSSVAKLFVATYSTKMANGFLRFQAQYLRRIRLPRWADVTADQRAALRQAVARLDPEAIDAAAFSAYGLDRRSTAALRRLRDFPKLS
ncbi:MAG TPA: Eco57I restriction-modification methylase domain-containing protein [Opitutaceae bacterium]|nr:Eco57I restriction-modification methylase domain-containing protein [Opitutaceae bacterium]